MKKESLINSTVIITALVFLIAWFVFNRIVTSSPGLISFGAASVVAYYTYKQVGNVNKKDGIKSASRNVF